MRLILAVLTLCSAIGAVEAKQVPNVLGLTPEQAVALLKKENYEPVLSGKGVISVFRIGSIGRQNPAGGDEAKPKSKVEIYLSSGVWIRDFVGEFINDDDSHIATELDMTGVAYTIVRDNVNCEPKGKIVKQEPPSNGNPPDFGGSLEVEFSRHFERGDSDEEEQIHGPADHVCAEAGGGRHGCS